MPWLQVHLTTDKTRAPLIELLFENLGALSVTLGDAEDEPLLELDPGLAFGTGTHPTTALCLQWLDQAGVKDTALMDFGCGSGILAIAALKLGAQRAVAIDHDPQALQAIRDNAARNGVMQDA